MVDRCAAENGLPTIVNAYTRSDDLEDLMFVQVANANTVRIMAELFRRKPHMLKEATVWCNVDRPCQERIPLKLIFSIRKLLAKWGFQKRNIKVNEETCTMTIGDLPILKAIANDNTIDMTWLDEEWKSWDELHNSTELRDIVMKAQADFETAHEKSRKGLGKGKHHSK